MSQKRLTVADEPFLLVRTLAAVAPNGHRIPPHAHRWHQLIYACAGVMHVWTEAGSWIVPPHWAIWVPAGTRHAIRFAAASTLRTLYIAPLAREDVPSSCCAVTVSALLRALIDRAVATGALDSRQPAQVAMAALIAAECRASRTPPFDLPQPQSALLRDVAARAAKAGAACAAASLAREAGLSVRTLQRRFLAETGMSLGRWQRQAGMLAALELLAAGGGQKQAAPRAGYATQSAFVSAFHGIFGTTPGRYFQGGEKEGSVLF